MIKINYIEPEQFESLDDIAITNIKICDKYKKVDYLELSSISWLKIDPKRNYQDLEQLFRHLNLNSYVISQTLPNIPQGLRIGRPNEPNLTENVESDELIYIAKITCIEKDKSMSELSKYHTTWEDNYECLKFTGCLMALKQETSKEDDENIDQTKCVDEVKKLLECKLKLDLEYYTVKESIDFIINDLTNKYGKKPEKFICGEVEEKKVWALMIDGQIVSPIGWMEKIINQDNQEQIYNVNSVDSIDYELIDFRKIKIERD